MTRVMVRRRCEPVEAVQWRPGVYHPCVNEHDGMAYTRYNIEEGWKEHIVPGTWIIRLGHGYRVLTPEQFAEEYERVE